ncbi:hypothetical protein AGMMS49531_06720 [Endomicrobiia bacterium]|nr:hypothetical protein AGMMS49531_06720 [Endomicrobiia bacterium]
MLAIVAVMRKLLVIINNGKLKMLAIVAVMRKLLVIINNCCKQFYLDRSYMNA